jgi:hypothetical protein
MPDKAKLEIRWGGSHVWMWCCVISADLVHEIGPVSDCALADAINIAVRLHRYCRRSRAAIAVTCEMEGQHVQQ